MSTRRQEITEFKIGATALTYALVILMIGVAFRGSIDISNLGSWLAGTLTPGLLLASILSFRTAEVARREQAEAQQKMAEITERATFSAQKEVFERYLSYLGSCVLERERLSMTRHKALLGNDGNNGGYERLWYLLVQERYSIATPSEREEICLMKQNEDGFFLNEFQKSLLEVMRIGYSAGLYSQLDRRLKELPSLFTFHNLWKINPDSFLDVQRPSFAEFFKTDINNT